MNTEAVIIRCHKCKRMIDNVHHFGHFDHMLSVWVCDDPKICERRGVEHIVGAEVKVIL